VRSLQSMTQHELEVHAFLHDIADSGGAIAEHVVGMTFEQYLDDRKTRGAVEREFIIIGEALRELLRIEPSLSKQIPESGQIIGFRNSLAHKYRHIDHQKVWVIIHSFLPPLVKTARTVLAADA
jgi:uncharacterized protein with HEPN domain